MNLHQQGTEQTFRPSLSARPVHEAGIKEGQDAKAECVMNGIQRGVARLSAFLRHILMDPSTLGTAQVSALRSSEVSSPRRLGIMGSLKWGQWNCQLWGRCPH